MANEEVTSQEAVFSKEQLLKSEKYKQFRDILASQLEDIPYTAAQADKVITDFLKKGVK